MSYPFNNLYAPPRPPYHPSHPHRSLAYLMMDFDELLTYPLTTSKPPSDITIFLSAAHHRLSYWRSALSYIWRGGAHNVFLSWEGGLGTEIQTIEGLIERLQEKVMEAEGMRERMAWVVDTSGFDDIVAQREGARGQASSTSTETTTRTSSRRSGGSPSSRR